MVDNELNNIEKENDTIELNLLLEAIYQKYGYDWSQSYLIRDHFSDPVALASPRRSFLSPGTWRGR